MLQKLYYNQNNKSHDKLVHETYWILTLAVALTVSVTSKNLFYFCKGHITIQIPMKLTNIDNA